MGITVREALAIGGLKKGEVIAGIEGLDNIIRHVSVIEVPDAFRWFRGYELWLTAFYTLKDDVRAQVQMIEEIAKRKSAGLVICYPNTYIKDISPELLRKANSLRIPVILVPEDVAYIDVISPILEEILARETKKLKYAFSVHERLTNVVFDKGKAGNMRKVAKELAVILGKAVILTDHRNDIVTSYEINRMTADILIDPSAIKDLLLVNLEELHNGKTLVVKHSPPLLLRPIVFGHRFYGTVIAVDVDGISKLEEIALDQARIAFAAGLMNRLALEETENQKKTDFLNNLAKGRFKTNESVIASAQQVSWDIEGKKIAIYGKMKVSDRIRDRLDSIHMEIFKSVQMEHCSNICHIGNSSFTVFLEGREEYDQIKKRAKVLGKRLIKLLRNRGADLVVGIGSYSPRPLDLKTSYEKARKTALIAKELMGFGRVISIDEVALYYPRSTVHRQYWPF